MPTLVQVREEMAAKSKALEEIFSQAGPELDMSKVMVIEGDSAAKAAEIRRRNDELTELGKQFDELRALDEMAKKNRAIHESMSGSARGGVAHPAGDPEGKSGGQREPVRKSIGDLFVETAEYKGGAGASRPMLRVEIPGVTLKTTISLSAGFTQAPMRTAVVVESAQRRPVVADLIPQDDTTANAIRYMEETTFTNAAAPVAEAAVKPESALAWTERTVPVEVVAHWIPITRQQLEDVPAIRGIVDNRLTFMLLLAEENQLLNGNGTSPQLTGFYNKTGIQTQAKGADAVPDAIYKAMTKVRYTGFAEPSGIVLHPNDWQDVRLLKTADGVYIWGSPAEAGPERIWGKPVVITTAATENTGLLGDFALYSHISRREGVAIDVSDSHSDFFIRNQLAIRAEERLSLEIYRAAAFATISGI